VWGGLASLPGWMVLRSSDATGSEEGQPVFCLFCWFEGQRDQKPVSWNQWTMGTNVNQDILDYNHIMGPPWTNPVFDTISWHCAVVVCMSHFMSLGPGVLHPSTGFLDESRLWHFHRTWWLRSKLRRDLEMGLHFDFNVNPNKERRVSQPRIHHETSE